jgi:hypothetical protein
MKGWGVECGWCMHVNPEHRVNKKGFLVCEFCRHKVPLDKCRSGYSIG